MQDQYTNIYKIARSNTSLTQREAAAKMFISLRSIADYETGKTTPPDDVVCMMIQIYRTEWLAYEHLRQSTLVGKKYLPKIDYADIAKSVLKLQKEIGDLHSINSDMISIACDGLIDHHESDRWSRVTKEISEVAGAALAVVFTQNKKTSLDGSLERVHI